jgi:cell wall-associated NlpC family hydrolase
VRALGAVAAACAGLLIFGAAEAIPEPAAIEAKRMEVARVQAELQEIDHQVEDAAEAYNGARYRLSLVRKRIGENRAAIVTTRRQLGAMRTVLAERLRAIYATPQPSLAEVLVSSGGIAAAVDQIDLLDRVGRQDAEVVGRLRQSRERLERLRAELIADRAAVEDEVAAAERQKRTVEALLSRRQAVLASAEGELARLLQAERERERREAAVAAQLARQRQAAAARQQPSATPSGPGEAAAAGPAGATAPAVARAAPAPDGSSPPAASEPEQEPEATPSLPSGSGNAAAASIAMQQLGVPYVWGGASPSGFDCSGLASYAYAQIGKSVPHYTVAIWNAFPRVPSSALQVGDLVFFRGLGHMGIYIGGGQYVNAPQTGDVVKVSSMSDRSDYVGAVRP